MTETARFAALLAAVLLFAGGLAGPTGAVQPPSQVDIDADSVTLQADVAADGDARWTVTYRLRLDDENATQAFEELAADVESDPSPYVDPFRQRMERTVTGAENATGREMSVRNVTVETRRESQPQVEFGVVTYRLEWTNFAAVDGETVRAGDAVDRLFLDSRTTLRLTAPEGYVLDSAAPAPTRTEADEAVWQGQRDFDAGKPRVVFVPEGGTPAETPAGSDGGDGGDGGDGTDTPASGDGGLPVVPLLAVVIVALLGGAWVVSRRGNVSLPAALGGAAGGGGDESGAAAAAGSADAGDEGPPPELLSNEEQVLRLLEENGGRMKQKAVAEELDWTAAKTSQVVGDLREDGEVESFRLGRENVLTLPDVDIDGAGRDDEQE